MPKYVMRDGGLVAEPGTGFDFGDQAPITSVKALTTTTSSVVTVTNPGMYTLSASIGRVTVALPVASTVPLGIFGFRSLTGNGHVLTSSEGGSNAGAFYLSSGTYTEKVGGLTLGTFVTMSQTIGSFVAVLSDGLKYNIFASSGSVTLGVGT